MAKQNKPLIGQILVTGGFLSSRDLDSALKEQQDTNEKLGQVLVRMGVLDPVDLQAALAIQNHLGETEKAVKVAAGVRRMLGDLLVQAGHIGNEQLNRALALQKRSGEKLGEVLIRMGLLNGDQLDFMLLFQKGQEGGKPSPGPLRLGEIMMSAGYISRQQLDEALDRQSSDGSGKKLGEVLIEEGYAEPSQVKHGIRLQKMLLAASMAIMLAACGGGGDGGGVGSYGDSQMTSSEKIISTYEGQESDSNYFVTTSDAYGLEAPTFYYSTDNEKFWAIQADIAEDVFDQNYRCIMRIYIPKDADGGMVEVNKTFSIEDTPNYEQFPGLFLIPNGQESTHKKVETGIISFESDSESSGEVKGSFDVVLTDYDSNLTPAPEYRITGVFNFKVGTYSPAIDINAEVS